MSVPFFTIKTKTRLHRSFWLKLGAILAGFLIFRFSYIHWQSLWQDEYTEIALSHLMPVSGCSVQSQPPLSCILTYIGKNIFGYNEFGVRFHVVLASALGSFFIFLFALSTLKNWIYAFFISICYSIYPVLIQYGFEVRPYSLGLLLGGIVLFWWSILDEQTQVIQYLDYIKLTSLSTLFLMSVGFQAPIFIFSFFFALFIRYLFFRRRQDLVSIICLIFAVSLFLPIQMTIVNSSPDSISLGFDLATSLNKFFSYMSTDYSRFLFQLLSELIILPLILLFLLYFKKDAGLFLKRRSFFWFNFFVAFFIFGPLFFQLFISNLLKHRYLLLGWTVAIFSSIHILSLLEFKNEKRKSIFFQLSFLLIVGYSILQIQKRLPIEIHQDTRAVFTWLHENMNEKDRIIQICDVKQGSYCFAGMDVLSRFRVYWPDEKKWGLLPSVISSTALYKIFTEEGHSEIERLFVAIERPYAHVTAGFLDILKQLPQIKTIQLKDEIILEFSGGKEWIRKDWFGLVDKIEEKYKGSNFYFSELILQKAILEKNYDKALEFLMIWEENDVYKFRSALRNPDYEKEIRRHSTVLSSE